MFNKLQDFLLPHLANRNAAAAPRIGEPAAPPAAPAVARPHQQVAGHDARAAARPGQAAEQRAAAGLRAEAAVARDAAPVRQLVAAGNAAVARRDVPAAHAQQAPHPQRDQRVIAPAACNAVVPRAQQGAVNNPLRNPVVQQAPNGLQAAPGLLAPPLWAAPPVAVQAAVRPAAPPVIRPAVQLAAPPVVQAAAPRAVQPAVQQAAPAVAPQARGPYPVRQPDRAIIAQQVADQVLKLRDLRIGNEKDHELVFAPPIPPGTFQPIVPPVDAASAGLEGREYLQFLVTDPRTCFGVRRMVKKKILENATLSDEKINNIAARMRGVMAELYRNEELSAELDLLGLENLEFCHDRVELSIGQMEDAALLSNFSAGRIDEITLFNYGISFFMRDTVREKVKQLIDEQLDGGEAQQGSHDYLNANFYLQDELHLPTRQEHPVVPDVAQGIVTRRIAVNVIGPFVKNRAIEKNGENIRKFMGTWKPWVDHLNRSDPIAQEMTASFQESLVDLEEFHHHRIARHIGGGGQDYINHMNLLSHAHNANKEELAGRIAEELLFNWRAEYLALQGRLPPYFG